MQIGPLKIPSILLQQLQNTVNKEPKKKVANQQKKHSNNIYIYIYISQHHNTLKNIQRIQIGQQIDTWAYCTCSCPD